ncbi:paraneoplastic antigen-like protein 8A [Erinaceus europaeus]|uniref:Paraneoplastic antigen-like protein 8A n=1 Tax=Erinaceus europaeus TaxID=9365 RepID=A0A1S3WMT2_ERIEU|nr:paraneoplastic antigen-like protein 8A [Erinaceus europaeus]
MAIHLLEDWCRGMELDVHRALLVSGIPEDCGQAELEETLDAVLLPLGPYHVLNKIFLREDNAKAALVELGEGVSLRAVPREFPARGGVWKVTVRDPSQDAEFLKNLNDFLDAEGRTWEDVVHLLQLNQPPRLQNQPPGNWAEVLGGLLGAVVQIVFYMDSEARVREEARAREAAQPQPQPQPRAAAAMATKRKIKKEPRPAAEGGAAAVKKENGGAEPDFPRPVVRRAGAKSRSRRKKPKKKQQPKGEPEAWNKPTGDQPSGSASLEEAAPLDDAENVQPSESVESNRKPHVKPEAAAAKKPAAGARAESPRAASEPDRDGGHEGPPKKKAMGWASTKSPGSSKKKKKMSLGPVSYTLQGPEDPQKPAMPKKGLGSRRVAAVQKTPTSPQPPESSASVEQGPKDKPEGSPPGTNAPQKR